MMSTLMGAKPININKINSLPFDTCIEIRIKVYHQSCGQLSGPPGGKHKTESKLWKNSQKKPSHVYPSGAPTFYQPSQLRRQKRMVMIELGKLCPSGIIKRVRIKFGADSGARAHIRPEDGPASTFRKWVFCCAACPKQFLINYIDNEIYENLIQLLWTYNLWTFTPPLADVHIQHCEIVHTPCI